jgi:SAM-dependent methyltransferase
MTEQTYALSAQAAEFYESTFVPALFRDWAIRLVEFADLEPGDRVLDVACGTGVVARTAADRLSRGRADATATVAGVDSNDAMLSIARRLRPDLRWMVGDAASLPFDADTFDVVLCQAALMFFQDRAGALADMGRVAGLTGRVVIQVPGRLSHSAGYRALTEVVARHAGPAALDLLGAYFAVGEPDLVRELFGAAGLRIDRFETWQGATRLDSIDTFLAVELLPIAETVDETTRSRIVADCRTALADFVDRTGAIAAPIEVHLVAGRLVVTR